ncbi:MAG: hypothetical protein AAGU74_14090 [Bacillota bacterium]
MFYMKHGNRKLEILDDNVYTLCPQCGQEEHVDIQEILSSGDADLCGTAVYCERCLRERVKELFQGADQDRSHNGK